MRVWTGTAWQPAVPRLWDGTSWRGGIARVWDGEAWRPAHRSVAIRDGVVLRDGVAIGRVLRVAFPGGGTVSAHAPSPVAYSIVEGTVFRDGAAIGRQLPVAFSGDGSVTVGGRAAPPDAVATFEPGVHEPQDRVFA